MSHTTLGASTEPVVHPAAGTDRRNRDVRRRRLPTVRVVLAADLASELADALASWSPPPPFASRVVASSLERPQVIDAAVARRAATGELRIVSLDAELLGWLRDWLGSAELPPAATRALLCSALRNDNG